MTEHFDTIDEAKARRNELLDASAFFEYVSFLGRYTKQSQEDGLRYRAALYDAVDKATFPGDITWPVIPVPQTIADFNASLESTNEPAL